MSNDFNLIWTDPIWKREVDSWIEFRLRDQSIEIQGPSKQIHVRPWSTVIEIPSSRGSFFFKALPDSLRHEVAVVEYISTQFPGRVPRVLAVDRERGWMLQYESGESLRQRLRRRPSVREWYRLLDVYAEIQTVLAAEVNTLQSFGVPDRRPGGLPSLFAELLANREVLHIDDPDGLAEATLAELRAKQPKLEFLCEQLAAGPIPTTIEHGDLHDANVFWTQGGPVVFDWADCSVAHPFFSLRNVFVSMEHTLGWGADDPRVRDVGTRYLESWTDWAPLPALRKVFQAAVAIAPLIAALRWKRALKTLPPTQKTYVEPIPRLLEELLGNLRDDDLIS